MTTEPNQEPIVGSWVKLNQLILKITRRNRKLILWKQKNFDHGKVTIDQFRHQFKLDLFLCNTFLTLRLWHQSKKKVNVDLKGAQPAMVPRRPEHYFCQFEKRLPQPEVKDTSKNPLQSCLVFHLILDLLEKTSFWANFYSSYEIILSYLVKNSTQRNINRGGEKRVGAGRKKWPSFTKITKEMNQ